MKIATGNAAQLYYVRHGETEWSLSGRHTGRSDIALTAHGEAQARGLSSSLQQIQFTRVLTSPRQRVRRTCELAGLGATAEIDAGETVLEIGDVDIGALLAAAAARNADEARAGLPGPAVQVLLASSASGQATKSRASAADRQEVEKLLVCARQAMKEGHLETADSLIGRAEAMNVDFSLFHMGDTPKKVRRDLDLRRKAARGDTRRPSERFRPDSDDSAHTTASNPPSAGPTMKPMLLAAPNSDRRPARFSPGVTSAM